MKEPLCKEEKERNDGCFNFSTTNNGGDKDFVKSRDKGEEGKDVQQEFSA